MTDQLFALGQITRKGETDFQMWCSNCQQDVPGVAAADDEGRICCARCSSTLSSKASESKAETAQVDSNVQQMKTLATSDSVVDVRPPVDLHDWEFEEDLLAVQRLVRSLRSAGVMTADSEETNQRVDSAQSLSAPHTNVMAELPLDKENRSGKKQKQKRKKAKMGFFAWTLLSFGLMTFVCGAVLLGWSFVEGRSELWRVGMPLTLGGQAFLLIGLLLQLESIWQSNRDTTNTLDELDEQLHELKHATTLLSTARSGHGQSFYAHMAEGASPQLLLSDLKGQLDMLAVRMANDR